MIPIIAGQMARRRGMRPGCCLTGSSRQTGNSAHSLVYKDCPAKNEMCELMCRAWRGSTPGPIREE